PGCRRARPGWRSRSRRRGGRRGTVSCPRGLQWPYRRKCPDRLAGVWMGDHSSGQGACYARTVSHLAFLLALALAPPPAFELRALGVLGGDWDENLSSYLLARPGQPATLMIDGGSVMTGIARALERDGQLAPTASWSTRARAAEQVLRPVRALLLTHSHLDHVAGFLIKSTVDI